MTPQDLITSMRNRINPLYAATPGTESYERRLCAEALEALLAEREWLSAENARIRALLQPSGTLGPDSPVRLRMTLEEALQFADEWSRGMTIHEGSMGWRVVCLLLAEEVRRRHGIGGELIAARRERDALLAAARQTLDENGHLADGDDCTLAALKRAVEIIDGTKP